MGTIGTIFNLGLSSLLLFYRINYLLLKTILIGLTWAKRFAIYLLGTPSKTLGSARFASIIELKRAKLLNGDGLLLGTFQGKTISAPRDDHLLCIAPTKSGKISCLVNTNLLKLGSASVVVNDPNGESFAITQRKRSSEGDVFFWAPFADVSHHFNPLDFVQVGTADERDDVELIASLIVPDTPYGSDEFWNAQAREVLVGVILFVLMTKKPERQTMAEVRHLITLSEEAFNEVLQGMVFCGHPIVRRVSHMLQNQDEKLRSNVMATVQAKTRIWDSPRLCDATGKSDFYFGELRHKTSNVYLIVPPERLDTYYPAISLITGVALAEINRTKAPSPKRVVFMLDEFANLGRLKPVENAISIARKAGIQLCLFVQDIAQIERVYGESWRSFAANCRTKVFFGVNEVQEAKNLSETLGIMTVKTKSAGQNMGLTNVMPDHLNSGTGEASRSLKTADEIMALNQNECLILQQGLRPILADKLHYKERRFKGLYDEWNSVLLSQ